MRFHRVISRALFCLSLGLTLAACGGAAENSETLIANDSAPRPICGLTPTCDTPALIGQPEGFQGSAPKGDAWHFGKDFYYNETNDQWVIAKFQYGNYLFRSPLVAEKVEIQLLRTCGGSWETLGSVTTTQKGQHPDVMGYVDEGGMVFFKIPESKKLGLGRHRIRLVVSGDQSATELYLEILERGTSLFVSDVDGTLTTSELIEGVASVFGAMAPAHSGSSAVLKTLASKGYRPLYLTARASNLVQRTRDFLKTKKFPDGMVMTSPATTLGYSGSKGAAYKAAVLQSLEDRGFNVVYAFGNSKTDAEAFANTNILDSNKYFYKFDGFDAFGGGQSFKSYEELDVAANAQDLCI